MTINVTPKSALRRFSHDNSLWDLYYLLSLFIKHDAEFADAGVRSLKERFKEVSRENPEDLRPDMLFDVLDPVTVRRTRHFVRQYYPHDRIRGPGGEEMVVQFPEPHVEPLSYDLEDVLPGFFDEIKEALAPEDETRAPLLTMARYCPSSYRFDQELEAAQVQLVGLIRSGLLKRFESSAYAFRRTAETMAQSHDAFLAALDAGRILTPKALEEWTTVDRCGAGGWRRHRRACPARGYGRCGPGAAASPGCGGNCSTRKSSR